jgi:PAS domain S-box-containing protein
LPASEHLQDERKLHESQERFRGVFEQAPSGIAVVGGDGRMLQVNAAFCRILGYSERELLSKAWEELIHPEDRWLAVQSREQLSKDPLACVDTERRYMHSSGAMVWARVRVSLVRDDGGNPLYCVAHVTSPNASGLKRPCTRAKIASVSWRTAARTMLWVTDAAGRVQFINRAYREMCGVTSEQAAGKTMAVDSPRRCRRVCRIFQRAVREHTPARAEARFRVPMANGAGSSRTPSLASRRAEFLGHVGLSLDITERKQASRPWHASEEKFRELAENIREVFWIMSPTTNETIYISPAYEEVWGRTCESLYQDPMSFTMPCIRTTWKRPIDGLPGKSRES